MSNVKKEDKLYPLKAFLVVLGIFLTIAALGGQVNINWPVIPVGTILVGAGGYLARAKDETKKEKLKTAAYFAVLAFIFTFATWLAS